MKPKQFIVGVLAIALFVTGVYVLGIQRPNSVPSIVTASESQLADSLPTVAPTVSATTKPSVVPSHSATPAPTPKPTPRPTAPDPQVYCGTYTLYSAGQPANRANGCLVASDFTPAGGPVMGEDGKVRAGHCSWSARTPICYIP